MDQARKRDSNTTHGNDDLASRRIARGYSLNDLAIATGLTVDEIASAEEGNGPHLHIERIEHALR